jgi:hypothetical protein
MMKSLPILCLALLVAAPALAGQPEARDVARMNNCTPKKIDVYQNQLGMEGKTVYQVTCALPKTTDKNAPANAPDSLLIACDQSLCELVRAVAPESK